MIKRISGINNTQSYFTSGGVTGALLSSACFYKMLKCESKLIRYLFESNKLIATDRHDWHVLWTHTTGKNYFYERLTPY
jgi:hypothetical protein